MTDTIAAISTPFGEGAIAVIRLSGTRALEIVEPLFRSKKGVTELESRCAQFGAIVDGDKRLDDVLVTVFRAPASYTGEDLVEISCHGGILVSRCILELILRSGARSAQPGEFTQRAFLNGKMDLTQAEAVMDLITAQTDLALRAATEQLEGRLGQRILALREVLLEILAHVEAYIDFPDEDIDPDTGDALLRRIDSVRSELAKLLATAGQGRILREGVRTVICGAPNVGKSSLLNLLLGSERAIVSPKPGTTRDVIEEVINLRGIPLRLVDTAGIRETVDEIEQEGMERTHRQIERADLVLQVCDASKPRDDVELGAIGQRSDGKDFRVLLVLNKVDLGEHSTWQQVDSVRISCLTGDGEERLAAAIEKRVLGAGSAQCDWSVAINTRHQACLQTASQFADATRKAFTDGLSPEFIAEELRAALDAVGDVVGRVDTEDVLGKIFSTFCIGK